MSSIQGHAPDPAPRANRPFTRAHNDLYDKIKPGLYHKVDRSVLDALIRCLEGYHQSWVALPIAQLAHLAAVSNWSVSKALGRLEAAGVICRRKKKLTKAGRFIWDLSLADPYRVSSSPMGPSHGTPPCDGPMAMKESLDKKAVPEEHHHDGTENDDASWGSSGSWAEEEPAPELHPVEPDAPLAEETPPSSPPGESAGEALAAQEPAPELYSVEPDAPLEEETTPFSPPSESVGAAPSPERFVAAHPRLLAAAQAEPGCGAGASAPQPGSQRQNVTPEQRQALKILRSVGIDHWKARRLAKSHPFSLISQIVEGLRHRTGTVRNPAAWIICELERGGYAPPPAQADLQRRQEEQAAKAMRQLQEEERQAQAAQAEQERAQRLLEDFSQWPAERQEALLHQVRERLRRVSPRLAMAPLDLDTPGPLRSQLLELLELAESGPGSRVAAGPTPRAGGWDEQRRGFSQPLQDPGRACATHRDG